MGSDTRRRCADSAAIYSLDYARQRLQGRLPNNKDPSVPPVPINEHADVKRMLLAQKAAVEGAMALTGYCAYLVDLQKIADDDAERERLDLLLGVGPRSRKVAFRALSGSQQARNPELSAATDILGTFRSSASIATTGSIRLMKARSAFRPSTCLDEKSGLTGAAGSISSTRK